MDDVGWLQKISRSGHLDQTERFEQLLDLVWYVMDSSVLHYESVLDSVCTSTLSIFRAAMELIFYQIICCIF